jgi:battenin
MCGVVLASLSSGGGELSFLGLTHYYGHFALAAWGSGTGGAGLIGAGAYAIATTTLQISPRTSLLAFSFLPVIMLLSFFLVLPQGPLRNSSAKYSEYEAIEDEQAEFENEPAEDNDSLQPLVDHDRLLSSSVHSSSMRSFSSVNSKGVNRAWISFKANLKRSRGLFFP